LCVLRDVASPGDLSKRIMCSSMGGGILCMGGVHKLDENGQAFRAEIGSLLTGPYWKGKKGRRGERLFLV